MTAQWLIHLDKNPGHVLFQGAHGCCTSARFKGEVGRLYSDVHRERVKRWVLYDDHGTKFVCALIALLCAGCEVIVPQGKSREAITALLEGNTGLICNHPDMKGLSDIEPPAFAVDERREDHRIKTSINSGKVTFSSSGTSGPPKLLTRSAEQLYLEVAKFASIWKPEKNTLFIPLVTHLHIYGLTFGYLLPLITDSSIYQPKTPGLLGVVEPIQIDQKNRIDQLIVIASPSVVRQNASITALAAPGSLSLKDRPAAITRVFCAGGRLSKENAVKMVKQFDSPVTEIFGSTETGAVASRIHNYKTLVNEKNFWKLLPGVKSKIAGENPPRESGVLTKGLIAFWGDHVGGAESRPVIPGDEVLFVSEREFMLLGRNNRVCKIEGKRISLTGLVELLQGCVFVEYAVVLPYEKNGKEVLLCGVVLSEDGRNNYRQKGKFNTDQNIRKYLLQYSDAVHVPRSIRYLDQMPENDMGKIPEKKLIEVLVDPVFPELPTVADMTINPDHVEIALGIPMELKYLRGHFDSRPIVPGLILLDWVYHFAEKCWKLALDPANISQLKFTSPMSPGDRFSLCLSRIAGSIHFLYLDGSGKNVASGQIALVQ